MLLQLIANGVAIGAGYLIVALGFALIYKVARFFHFAHAIIFTSCPYFAVWLRNGTYSLGAYSFAAAVVLAAAMGCLMEVLVFAPLRRRGASPLVHLLASVGLYVVLQNALSLVAGDHTQSLRLQQIQPGHQVFGIVLTNAQITAIVAGGILLNLTAFITSRTQFGKQMRAVADDSELASVVGVHATSVRLLTFALGSALAGCAGIVVALDIDMTPTMGMDALLMALVAVIVGGVKNSWGIALGALFLALAQSLGVWKTDSRWQSLIAFVIMVVFLLVRPQGFLGKSLKRARA